MRAILLFLCTVLAPAQTMTKSTSHVLQVPAGAMHCTFTNFVPAALSGIHIDCASETSSFKQDTALSPVPGISGQSGEFSSGRDSIRWTFRIPAIGGPVMYQITANGNKETGSL
jgi:hypothetical protein